ncbi:MULTISPECIES: chaplin [Streptomyces]|uniref:Chaplin n=1 Tax=Streptomyces glycanivorans TaxID=3033808 RepID=A0ABY9J6F9_9ACTN|nr:MULTISPECIES: chaplin [unclassified Streptomyces]WLQ63210.1 chaplin [Streptomyces sp. Alt3]
MRQVLNKSMIVMAAASGILTAAGGYAHADASADGVAANSPGVGSGNAVQVPVHVPVNLCGNTVNVIALLNPAFGNSCANVSSHDRHGDAQDDAYGDEHGQAQGGHKGSGASADGKAVGSPGVLSGNLAQVPVDVPVNVCGNSVNVVGLLNPVFGNDCVNDSGDHGHPPVKPPVEPPTEEPPTVTPPTEEPPTEEPPTVTPPTSKPPVEEPPAGNPGPNTPDTQLAQTGSAGMGLAAGASAGLLLGGAVLMRRTRASRN